MTLFRQEISQSSFAGPVACGHLSHSSLADSPNRTYHHLLSLSLSVTV